MQKSAGYARVVHETQGTIDGIAGNNEELRDENAEEYPVKEGGLKFAQL